MNQISTSLVHLRVADLHSEARRNRTIHNAKPAARVRFRRAPHPPNAA